MSSLLTINFIDIVQCSFLPISQQFVLLLFPFLHFKPPFSSDFPCRRLHLNFLGFLHHPRSAGRGFQGSLLSLARQSKRSCSSEKIERKEGEKKGEKKDDKPISPAVAISRWLRPCRARHPVRQISPQFDRHVEHPAWQRSLSHREAVQLWCRVRRLACP